MKFKQMAAVFLVAAAWSLLVCSCDDGEQSRKVFLSELSDAESFVRNQMFDHGISGIQQTDGGGFNVFFTDGTQLICGGGESVLLARSDEEIRLDMDEFGMYWCLDGQPTEVMVGYRGEGGPVGISIVVEAAGEVVIGFTSGNTLTAQKDITGAYYQKYFDNQPLPVGSGRLRVLAIGNSYAENPTDYLGELVRQSGIDPSTCCVYVAALGSASLQTWGTCFDDGDEVELQLKAGTLAMQTTGTLKELLSQPWDVVVFQQSSSLATDYASLNPSLRYLGNLVRTYSTNPSVAFAWQLVHGYYSGYGGAPYGEERWRQIAQTAQKVVARDGIDIVIPTGTAIENARNTELQTPHELTKDGTHLAYGTARYVGACTWFEALFEPVYGVSVMGNPALHKVTEEEKADSQFEWADVTEANRELCQQCAVNACKNKYEITTHPLSRLGN